MNVNFFKNINKTIILVSFSFIFFSKAVFAIDAKITASKKMDYITVPDIENDFTHDSALFGEELNHYSGSITFKRSDVKINTIGNLDFTYSMSYQTNFPELPGWLEEIPRIEISYGEAVVSSSSHFIFRLDGWRNGSYCSGKQSPTVPASGDNKKFFDIPKSFFSTPKLIIPNEVNDPLLLNDKAGSNSEDRYITNSGWSISCNDNSDSGNEGFIAKAPNGNKYYFDVLANIGGVTQSPIQGGNTDTIRLGEASQAYTDDTWGQFHALKIKEAMFISKIEDKFGNWVKFEYSPKQYKFPYSSLAHYTSNQLSKVTTSDKQVISVDVVNNIKKVTFNGRQWQYYKESGKFIVELPTKQKWEYDLNWASATMPDTEGGPPACYLDYSDSRNATMNIVHPTGAKGRFLFDLTRIDSANQFNSGTTCRTAFSLKEKEIFYDAEASYLWQYKYSSNEGQKAGEVISDKHKLKGRLPENIDSYLNKTLTITMPDNTTIKEYINRDERSPMFGRINATEYYNSKPMLVKETRNSYQQAGDIGSKIKIVGSTFLQTAPVNVTAQFITDISSGDKYEILFSDFNFFGASQLLHEKFSNATSSKIREKYTHYTYKNDYGNWVINLPSKTYINDTKLTTAQLESATPVKYINYDYFSDDVTNSYSHLLLPSRLFNHGVFIQKYKTYHSDGNVGRIEFNQVLNASEGNRFIEYANYKGGVAQITVMPNRYTTANISANRIINKNGWITKTTDYNGTSTNYKYDQMGRLLAVNQANDEKYGNWLDTVINWDDINNTRSIKRCTLAINGISCADTARLETVESYDSLLRLTSREVFETVASAKTLLSRQNFAYNYMNQLTFVSFPSISSNETQGTTTKYDALGRIDTVNTSGLGDISYDYLSNNSIQVTDAQDNITTTAYQAFGTPIYQQAILIESPETVTTSIDVDVLGLINSITQGSFTESRYYDGAKQLCLVKRADVGNTIYDYNALGEKIWEEQGALVTGTTCVTKTDLATTFSYDNHGALQDINYSDNSPDVTYTRDNNGNLTGLLAGSVSHSYNYNNQNLLENESLVIPGRTGSLSLNYGYDNLENLASIEYPDGLPAVQFMPNALGQATQAIRNYSANPLTPDIFVHGGTEAAEYYPNGTIKSFYFGNGIKHFTGLNSHQVPELLLDYIPSYCIRRWLKIRGKKSCREWAPQKDTVSLWYNYDNNSNIKSITNRLDSNYSLTDLSYDGLDRLISTTGSIAGIGSSSISYDSLGNISSYSNDNVFEPHDLTYTYSTTKNRLTRLTGTGSSGYQFNRSDSYDTRGNITHNGKRNFSYNRANQMVSSLSNSYLYDGYNRRVKSVKSGGINEYSMYSQTGKLLYRETPKGGVNYIFLGDKLVAKEGTGVVSKDSIMNYKPFGSSIEESKDQIGYTGHKFDKDLGLSYMQARYYDPVIGRFYSNDPMGAAEFIEKGNIQGFNRYAYANNNPYKYTDPNGENPLAVLGAIIGGVTSVTTTLIRTGGDASMKQLVGAAVGGAVAGGIAGLTGGASLLTAAASGGARSLLTGAASTGIAGAAGDGIGQAIAAEGDLSKVEGPSMLASGAIAATGGAVSTAAKIMGASTKVATTAGVAQEVSQTVVMKEVVLEGDKF
jgi:RHS repeat-associated protein